jgi:predicted  nucleic acid-binding Zn-ribbon protein
VREEKISNIKYLRWSPHTPDSYGVVGQVSKISKKGVALLVALALFLIPISTIADERSDLQNLIDRYAQEAQSAKTQATQKEAESKEIKYRISLSNQKISGLEAKINNIESEINNIENKIAELDAGIKTQEESLAKEKEKTNTVVTSWYMEGNNASFINTLLSQSTLAEAMSADEYYNSIRRQIEDAAKKIQEMKVELEAQKGEQNQKMIEQQQAKEALEGEKSSLYGERYNQNRLLTNAQSVISDLRTQESSAKKKIAELQTQLDALSSRSNWGGDIISSNDSSWYFNQLNYPNTYLGNSIYTIAQYGCLITSLAMVATFYGNYYDPPTAVRYSTFDSYGGLRYTSIVDDHKCQAINWGLVDGEISSGHPVVIGVDLPGVSISGNCYGVDHWVVIKPYSKNGSTYSMHDPLGGGRGYSSAQVKAMRIIRP